MKILSLDLGTKTGWALQGRGGHITSGEQEFKSDRFEGGGMRYLRFKSWLSTLKEQAGGLDLVTFEEVRRHAGTTAAHLYGGFLAHLTAWCEIEKIPYRGIPVATIKQHATGKGNAGKGAVIAAMVKKGHKHLQVKTNSKGKETGDDNEADALAILYYSLEHFVVAPDAPAMKRVKITTPRRCECGRFRSPDELSMGHRSGKTVWFCGECLPL